MLPYGPIIEFHIGALTIQSWGLMVALGFIAGMILILYQAKKENADVDSILNLVFLIFIASMAGARVFYVFLFWKEFSVDWLEIFRIWHGGMVYYGGFIFAIAAWILYARAKHLDFWKLADWGAPALALGLAIGRVGCHFIRDHLGVVTNVPWAVGFNGELRHETAMYSILANLTIFLILWFWLRKKNFPKGTLFAIFLIWYAVARFITDFFRAYDLPYSDPRFFVFGNFGGLTISQIISIAIFVLGIWLVFYLKKSKMPARG